MRNRRMLLMVVVSGLVVLTLGFGPLAGAQDQRTSSVPDLTGLWEGGARDIGAALEREVREIPFTRYGADRYQRVDLALNPNGYCLPPGPSRAITGPSPFLIVQSDDVVALLHENHGVYRPVYIDGEHPEDILDYPQFMGHSIGTWDGDTLVVDTIAINERTWLDSYGLEHSLELRLTERFRRAGPDTIEYSVTYEDPVFFEEPWTLTLELDRLTDTRLIEYVCSENERDRVRLQSTPGR